MMKRSLALGALILAGSLGNAQAATITFEDIAADGMGSNPGIRTSGGFVFTPGTHSHILGAPGTADAPQAGDASNGTQYLAVDDVFGPDPVTFSPQGGGVFALLGFDIGEWSNNGPGGNFAHQIEVLGILDGGGTLSTTLAVDGVQPAFDTFTFTGWTNLSSVTLKGINGAGPQNSFGLDNIVVEAGGAAVPEPGTLSLVGLGSAYLIRRRRHNA
jgi:PEP-CTERM motif